MTPAEATTTGTATLRRAYAAMERMERRLAEHERARSEPIAVVGLACRFPGAADADAYWEVLRSGTDAITEIPPDRWDADAYYSAEPQQPGKMSTRWGGFIDGIDRFDHEFFGVSRREAISMDPQQRLTLEVAWEALEDAGQAPSGLAGSRTGVFMGVCSNDFATAGFTHPREVTAHASTGTAHSVVTGRLSYVLDLRGPSVAIDSACSSSLVAVHQACQNLRAGECDLALAGGVNAVLSPLPSVAFSQFPGMVSPDGRCRTFDAAANGYVRSEGCGVVVLKRLSDAVRDGDRVLALVRGGAVNQDGRSAGVTAPNGTAQRDVLRAALAAGGVTPDLVSYVEAHGTGTRLGDPIEVDALAEVYGRESGAPVYLGSAKTNIGHPEAAAGIAGLIKVVIALDRGLIPPNVHFTELNPHLSFAGTTFAVPTEPVEWPRPHGRRLAGVSSFGFSGTNAHVVLEEAPAAAERPGDDRRPRSVLALSAKSQDALDRLARRYAARLATASEPVADLCHSAATGRSHFRYRLAATGRTGHELAETLEDYLDGIPGEEPATGRAGAGEVVLLFTGQGPQRAGMARGLYETQPTFRAVIDHCDEVLRPVLDVPLLSVLYPDRHPDGAAGPALIDEMAFGHPAMFAVEYGLAELWRSWGVEPAAVMGHSFGEYVAACVAGVMSLEDGLGLAVERGRLLGSLASSGAMASVFAPESEVAEAIAALRPAQRARLSIAAVNGPANTVVSGERAPVEAVCAGFAERGISSKFLHIATSSHSPLVEPILQPLRIAASKVRAAAPRIPLVSNVEGGLLPWDEAPDAEYWCRHARLPVRFAEGMAALREMGHRIFVEVGPAPTLLGLAGELPDGGERPLLLPSLRPGHDDWQVMLSTLARLYTAGVDVDWAGFDRDYARAKVPVPTYPFERTRCRREPCHPGADGPAPSAGPEADRSDGEGAGEPPDEELLYELAWRPAEPAEADAEPAEADAEPAEADGEATWLLLGGAEVAERFASLVAARGHRCVRASFGPRYAHDEAGAATVRAGSAADLARLVRETVRDGAAELRVVHLAGLDRAEPPDACAEELLAAQHELWMSAAHLVRALADPALPHPARLWLVTRGAAGPAAQPAGPQPPPMPGPATLWGLGRSLQQEHAGLWGGLIDLDPQGDPQAGAAGLLREIESADGEDQVALRGGERHLARLVRAPLPAPAGRGVTWRKDATYLVTGGLGGLGLQTARSIVRAGGAHLVLIGRTPVPPRAEWGDLPAGDPLRERLAAVRELESLGANVRLETLDVSDEQALRSFFERFDREGRPPVRGVVHAAGTGDVVPVGELERADLDRHLRAKALGAWNLHRLLADRPLDFFAVHSSTSSLLSSPFVAPYAAANAYVDALIRWRRETGRPGLSINWGIWDGTGMAAREAESTPGRSQGMGTLPPRQALRVFHRLLGSEAAQVAVVPVEWSQWGSRYQRVSRSGLLAELLSGDGPRPRRAAGRVALPSRDELLALPPQERRETLTGRLAAVLGATLGGGTGTGAGTAAGTGAVDPDRSLFDLGLDSLMAVEVRNEVERRLHVSLPLSVLLEGATTRNLAEALLAELPGTAPADGEPARDGAGGRVERAEDIAERLLAEIEALPEEAPEAGRPAPSGGRD